MRRDRQQKIIDYSTARARRSFLRSAEIVADCTGVPFRELVKVNRIGRHSRRDGLVFARRAVIYLAVVAGDVRMASLARAIERPRRAVLKACRMAEEERDDFTIDALFDRMEAML